MREAGDGRAGGRDGSATRWADLLAPMANMRAFGDVQAEALRAAGDLVERLAHAVDGPSDETDASSGTGEALAGSGDAGRLVDAWVDILSRVGEAFAGPVRSTGPVEVDLDGGPSGELSVVVGRDAPAAAEFWLRNARSEPAGPLKLAATGLTAADGTTLPGALVIDPSSIDEMPPRSTRGVRCTIAPAQDAAGGPYRGLMQVGGAPTAWLAVTVTVGGETST